MSATRFECVLVPENGGMARPSPVISVKTLTVGMRIKVKKTWWVVKVALPAEDNRPHIGDLLASYHKAPKP